MERIKIIHTEEEYQEALAFIDKFMDIPSEEMTPEELDKWELITHLIEKYENEHYPIPLPDPVDAIKFRMEQENLTLEDMRKYLGSKKNVSDILNRKKKLSYEMMRALHEGLGISEEVLLEERGAKIPREIHVLGEYPFVEMFKNGYFPWVVDSLNDAKKYAEEILNKFFLNYQYDACFCKKTESVVCSSNAMAAWCCRVCNRLENEKISPFNKDVLTDDFFRTIATLSSLDNGPKLAVERLREVGIHVIFEKHLSKTYLDGATFWLSKNPVIAMTLRYDRLDNFWFTLLHELAHIKLHLSNGRFFYDDIDNSVKSSQKEELEANQLAKDSLIPMYLWETNKDILLKTKSLKILEDFAKKAGVNIAIVVGRVRWENNNFKMFTNKLGKIRYIFDM